MLKKFILPLGFSALLLSSALTAQTAVAPADKKLPAREVKTSDDKTTTPATDKDGKTAPVHKTMSAEERTKAMVKNLTAKLGLSEEQAQKTSVIYKEAFEKVEALRADKSLETKLRREKQVAISNDRDKAFEAILTPDQLKQFKQRPHAVNKPSNTPARSPKVDKNVPAADQK